MGGPSKYDRRSSSSASKPASASSLSSRATPSARASGGYASVALAMSAARRPPRVRSISRSGHEPMRNEDRYSRTWDIVPFDGEPPCRRWARVTWSVREHRHLEAGVAAEEHRPRDRRGTEAVADLIEREVDRAVVP